MQRICHDLFGIAERIRVIDPAYTIFYRPEQDRYEVHWRGKLAFVIPFDFLDVRTLEYTQKTRRENADEIEREIDEGNAALVREQAQRMQKIKEQIKDYVQYDFERFN